MTLGLLRPLSIRTNLATIHKSQATFEVEVIVGIAILMQERVEIKVLENILRPIDIVVEIHIIKIILLN